MPDLYARRPTGGALVPAIARVWHAFSARPERVFDGFLDPDVIRTWFGPGLGEVSRVDVHAHVDGKFSIEQRRGDTVVTTTGTYRTIDHPRRLVFSWATPAAQLPEALVTIDIEPRVDGGSAVMLTHQLDPSWASRIAEIEADWTHMLDALSEVLEDPGTRRL
jgi:uncharacterized protein YndB with AHSA1/START domain